MKQNIKIKFLLLLIPITCYFSAALNAKAAADAIIYINPGVTNVNAGSDFSVDVMIDPKAHYVTNADFNFTYDQTKFVLASITPSSTFSTVMSAVDINNGSPIVSSPADGTGLYGAANFSSHITTVSKYATLNFHAIAAVTNSPIAISNSTMVYADNSPTYPSDAGNNVVGTRTNGAVTITSTISYTIGGTISGLKGTVVLQNNDGDDLTISNNGTFTFATAMNTGESYFVHAETQPNLQYCSVTNGEGTINSNNITNINVVCHDLYSIGGSITGLNGTLVLQNTHFDEEINVTSSGQFTFPTASNNGDPYGVVVFSQPTGQTCSVTNGSGTISGANITNVSVNCVNNPIAPIRSNGGPSGQLAAGTSNVQLTLTTNVASACKYSTVANTTFNSMTSLFAMDNQVGSDGLYHYAASISGLSDGTDYHYYVRCQDQSNLTNTDDYIISFSIATPPTSSVVTVITENNNNDDNDHHSSKKDGGKKEPKPAKRKITSKDVVSRFTILTQSGKRFSKNSPVLLYFSKPGGGFYPPSKVITSSKGSFTVRYFVLKPVGTYNWYAVDQKTGKRSKNQYYRVR